MEPAMSDEELREYDAQRALDYQEAQAWERAQDQIAALTAQRDEARAEMRRLTAALATARREGAEEMRRAAGQVCHDVYLEDPSAAVAVCIDAIRALPLDAPGGAT